MLSKKNWPFEIYFLLILFFTLNRVFDFFSPQSHVYLFFSILCSFSKAHYFFYFVNFTQLLMSLLHCLLLGMYVYRWRVFPTKFWKYFLLLKIFFDMTGHGYEWNSFIAMMYSSPKIAFIGLFGVLSLYVPAYVAGYRYVFEKK